MSEPDEIFTNFDLNWEFEGLRLTHIEVTKHIHPEFVVGLDKRNRNFFLQSGTQLFPCTELLTSR